ncbi:GTPase-activating protein [Dispira simplex]|nr:GTPase-activating protein [Dispira simplex]
MGSFWRRQPSKAPGRILITDRDFAADHDEHDFALGGYPGVLVTSPTTFWSFHDSEAKAANCRRPTHMVPVGIDKVHRKLPNSVTKFLDETSQAWEGDNDNDSGLCKSITPTGGRNTSHSQPHSPTSHNTTNRTSAPSSPNHSPNSKLSRKSGEGSQIDLRVLGDPRLEKQNIAEMLHLNTNLARTTRFETCLKEGNVDLVRLRKLSWNGIPEQFRAMTWQLLMGYLPTNADRRAQTLARKRKEYADCVAQTFAQGVAGLESTLWHQIQIDVPRTFPMSPLFQDPVIQQSIARILYCWADRHPASGYVQGINDLVTPFYLVFLSSHISNDPEHSTSAIIPNDVLSEIEADSFWCLSKLLDGIQDNYIHAQPGIFRQAGKLKELIARINQQLANHLEAQGIEFIQFAFRWINCLLMREVSLKNIVRMWDTYLVNPYKVMLTFY